MEFFFSGNISKVLIMKQMLDFTFVAHSTQPVSLVIFVEVRQAVSSFTVPRPGLEPAAESLLRITALPCGPLQQRATRCWQLGTRCFNPNLKNSRVCNESLL